jgi:protease II
MLLSAFALADDTYQNGKILKWDNASYATGSKKHPSKNWIVYQLQGDNNSTYSIARTKETKPEMQAGDAVQYQIKKSTEMTVIRANGKKQTYQIVGHAAAQGQ